MIKLITYGTFDLVHVGHIRLLKRLKALGDHLTVGISTDEFNELKGKQSIFSYSEREEIISSLQYVDDVIPETSWEQKRSDITQRGIDIFVMGDDWRGRFDDLQDLCKVIYLPRTKDISTTAVKKLINELQMDEMEQIQSSAKKIFQIVQALKTAGNY